MRSGKIFDVYVGRTYQGIVNEQTAWDANLEARTLWGPHARIEVQGASRSPAERREIARRRMVACVPKRLLH